MQLKFEKKETEYCLQNGRVQYRTVVFQDGFVQTERKIQPGLYTMGTEQAEFMRLYSGELLIRIRGKGHWRKLKPGDTLRIPRESSYDMKVIRPSDFWSSYH